MRRHYNRVVSLALTLAILVAGLPAAATPVIAGINDLVQLDYRIYRNVDAVQPTTALAAENTAANGPTQGAVYHIRMNVDNTANPRVNAGEGVFTLQFGTSTSGPWTDVGQPGSGATWRGFDNPTPADADALTAALLASTNNAQTYEEANDATNINRIKPSKPSEFGWVVQDNSGVGGTTYFFRLVLTGGVPLSSYTNYPQITPAVASVTVTESAASTDVTEGGVTDTYDVVLDAEPSADVTITLSPDADVSVSSGTLTFTTGNFATPQTVTVTAVNDAVVEGAHTGTITHSAAGGGYDGVSIPNVVANVTDNDTAGVTVTESVGSTDVTEGGATDTYDVVLDVEPSGTVTITITPDADVSVSSGTLTFTTGDFATSQTVTVTAVDDSVVEGAHTGTITHSAAGGGYDGVSIANVVANVTDNDTASVTVTESGGSTDVIEGGGTDSYDVVLDVEPSGTVTITITPDADVSVSSGTLTFTTGDFATPQTVTVTAVDDSLIEGAHTGTITHSAAGGGYDGVSIANVVANVTDNDTPGVTVTESVGSTDVIEGGATDTYDVVLDVEPSGTVTITITPDADVSVSSGTLTFTTGDFATPQTVTVTAVDDFVVEGAHTGTITHSAAGGGYDGVSISNVVANVTDNDIAGSEVLNQLDYRWFTNADSESPGAALATETTALTGAVEGTPYHLRMNVDVTVITLGAGEIFKLQFATSTGGPWTDVGALGSGEVWRGFDNATPADGATLGSALLPTSFNNARQTYEEANNSAPTPNDMLKDEASEWAWVVQPNATLANTTYYFRMIRASGTPLETYTNYPTVTMGNATPDNPTTLGPAQFVDNDTGWTNDNTPTLSFTLSDPDGEQQVQFQVQVATDSAFSAMVTDFTSDLQSQGATTYTVGQTGGTYATGSAGMTLSENGAGYFWRVLTLDELAASSSFSPAGAAGTADFRVDTTPPTSGTVADGAGSDVDFNDGSLDTMSANWSSFGDALSGVVSYEYSVGTSPGFINIRNWTSNGGSISVTDASLILHTGQTYYFNVRATDAAGNTMATSVSSDGQAVLPTFSVSVSATDIQLGNFNLDNNNTQSQTVTVTVSTNAFNGYVIQMYALDFLRSEANAAVIIPDFSAGTYANPAVWSGSDTGWGFNTDDCDLNGGDFWTGGGCTGDAKYAPITQLGPGDIVANHTTLVTGSTGAVVLEQFTVTLRASTAKSQLTSTYGTILVFVVVPNF